MKAPLVIALAGSLISAACGGTSGSGPGDNEGGHSGSGGTGGSSGDGGAATGTGATSTGGRANAGGSEAAPTGGRVHGGDASMGDGGRATSTGGNTGGGNGNAGDGGGASPSGGNTSGGRASGGNASAGEGSAGRSTGGSASGGEGGGGDASGGGGTGGRPTDDGGAGSGEPAHDICVDLGDSFGMGAAIFGDPGTEWYEQEATHGVDWTYGYMYASGDPQPDPEGFEWITNYRLDTAEGGGASVPTVTFYRMLNVGRDHGHGGTEPQVVQAMLTDADAVSDYLDDFVDLLEILHARSTPTLVHVEPDSWGFMMWAFDGVDGDHGNADASAIPVALAAADHPALAGTEFADDAGGLGQALLYLRDQLAPELRMGWHASNFRVGTHPEVVTGFYSSMGSWDVIVTEPPHMKPNGSASWDENDGDNQANLQWFETVTQGTGLPILIWQTPETEGQPYIGAWPDNQDNLTALASRGAAGVMWDPNGSGCSYSCAAADDLHDYLVAYSNAPLTFPAGNPCAR